MTTTTNHDEPSVTDTRSAPMLELRLPVDVDKAPLGYDDYGGTLAIELSLAGGGSANPIFSADIARARAGEPDPNSCEPASTLALAGTEDEPAQMRFVIALTIQGQSLHDADLRAAIVENLVGRFNTVHVAVSRRPGRRRWPSEAQGAYSY